MKVIHRISLASSTTKDLVPVLESHGISFNQNKILCTFEIGEEEDYEKQILALCKELNAPVITRTEYSQSEYDAAAWYTMRSKWHWSYPQPESSFAYCEQVYHESCRECGCGKTQQELFRVRFAPKWGTARYFAMLYWVEDELFASDRCIQKLQGYGINGFESLDVIHHKTGQKLPDLHQLKVTAALPKAFDSNCEGFSQLVRCPQCGSTIILCNGRPKRWNPQAFEDLELDVYKTTELFGSVYGYYKILISKRLYTVLQQERMTRDLVLEPVLFSEKG